MSYALCNSLCFGPKPSAIIDQSQSNVMRIDYDWLIMYSL